jgi:GGDEF domain-containing protein
MRGPEANLRYCLESEVRRATRYSHFLALIACRSADCGAAPVATDDEQRRITCAVIRSSIRRTDMLVPSTAGIDVLVLPETAEAGALALARRLADSLRPPRHLEARGVGGQPLMAIAVYPGDASTASGLVKCLELLMRRADAEGEGIRTFSRSSEAE